MILIEWTSFPREIPWCGQTFNQIPSCVSVERPTQRGLSRTPLMHHYGSLDSNLCFFKTTYHPWYTMICLLFVLEKTFGSPLEFKEIKPVNPKGNQPWIFIRRTVSEALILWPPGAKSGLTEKDPDAGKDWRQKEKRAAEDERVRQHHWLNGCEFEQTPGENGGQRSLVYCCPWDHKESDKT